VITIHQRHRRTDGRTDGRTDRQTTCDRNTALCTKVHRAVKTTSNLFNVVQATDTIGLPQKLKALNTNIKLMHVNWHHSL